MNNICDRLTKADPSHFTRDNIYYWFNNGGVSVAFQEVGWHIAGWCLEKMQKRWGEIFAEADEETASLREFMTGCMPLGLTPEIVIETYCDWMEAKK